MARIVGTCNPPAVFLPQDLLKQALVRELCRCLWEKREGGGEGGQAAEGGGGSAGEGEGEGPKIAGD